MSELDRDLAIRAYTNLSHFPERRAESDIKEFGDAVAAFEAKLTSLAKAPEQQALIPAQVERYRENYITHQNAIWHAASRTASSFITGPANFPTRANEKRGNTLDRRRAEFLEWKAKAEKSAVRAIMDARSDEQVNNDEWRILQRRLAGDIGTIKGIDAGHKPYARACFVTSIAGRIERLANNGEGELVRKALQFIRDQQADMAKPIFTDRHSIWQSIVVSDKVDATRPTGEVEIIAKGDLRVVTNHDADRVQIFFPGKPDEPTRATLKGSGWKWSPSNQAWQRKATPAAEQWAKQFAEARPA